MRRILLRLVLLSFCALAAAAPFEPVVPGKPLAFPHDLGSHPAHRIEWWYVTGHLESAQGPLGFQVTFFRVRVPEAEADPGRFSPRQLLFAHAALADPAKGRLVHAQRAGRALDGLVEARTGDTHVRIDDWRLVRESGVYRTRIDDEALALDLAFHPTQPILLQGDRGYSRKGPLAHQASYYYSEPQLRVEGQVKAGGKALEVKGTAWLDHEWSSEYLAREAAGWDWLGANLDDGSALMAFRIRGADGQAYWAGGSWRPAGGAAVAFGPEAVRFVPRRTWRSPRTGSRYPVAMDIRVGERTFRVDPVMDDQELDARATTGTLYWEGAVRVTGSEGSKGRGYLELTGYAERVPM
jgi:predicted secreted hydrolase